MTTPVPARRGPGRPRGGDGDRTRSNLLDAAVEQFAAAGFRGTSLGKIAERAGLSQAGLLHHFPSKLHLLAEVLRRRDEMDGKDLALRGPGKSGWDRFELLVELVRVNAERPGLVQLYTTMAGEAIEPDHPARAWLQDHLMATTATLTEALHEGQAAGTVRADAPVDRIVQMTIAVLDGLQIQWLALPPGEDGRPAIDMVADVREWVDTLRGRWEIPA
ncbi:DNA-binding transcriptional regulator, AcrR family [Nakamurella panacisegetis]|uniref:DNA-binding transcriptional regulator, AcrR family n=1 Tax=Nakamurella panacisegetis TaxID=1090615 RepID=A0A1H0JD59_9ACTN|nr:TetR/AcrR family transcriptional regulator [Nakamurella panacisegetis]SDO41542.1 DNA-binding transcriptional regulator, AcrR family [Nakamurella panacisegetis]